MRLLTCRLPALLRTDALQDVCRKPQVRQGLARLHGISPDEVDPAQFAHTLAARFNPERRRAMSTHSVSAEDGADAAPAADAPR